ncbi:MAG: malate dehydrogenase [Rickettsiales bacterium]|nr:MAG: malate dehydrogenase [Rickettsiales bacterium]
MKITFIGGAGRVGTSTCYAVGLNSIFDEILLFDKDEDAAKGLAIDMEQAFILAGKNIKVSGSYDYNDIKGSDVIIITASIPTFTKETQKTGGENGGLSLREAMLEGNKAVITDIANNLKKVIPLTDKEQPLIAVLTNPMDIILSTFMRVGGFSKKKTIGSGNWLDSTRFKYYFSKEFGIPACNIEVFAAAQHGAKITYLISQAKVEGTLLLDWAKKNNVPRSKIDEIVEKAINGGQEIINLQHLFNSTVWGPGMSLFELADAYIRDKKKVLVASVWCNGEYGVRDFAFGCPIVLGKNGVERILELDISDEDKTKYAESLKFAQDLDNANK